MYVGEPIGSGILVPKTRFGSRMAAEFGAANLLAKLASILPGESGPSRRLFTETAMQFKRSYIIYQLTLSHASAI